MKRWLYFAYAMLVLCACNLDFSGSAPVVNPLSQTPPPPTDTPIVTPTPSATPTPCPASVGAPYTVQRGDTLSSIAKLFEVPLEALIANNCLENPNRLQVGQEILIPGITPDPSAAPTPTRGVRG
jgi:LysM repeat protein